MTFASVRAAAEHAARQGKLMPHQLAAFTALDQSLSEQQKQEFTELWRAAGSPAAPPEPDWLGPALHIIKEFEGCRLEAYPDPGTGGVPWTIGYGTTRYPGPSGGPVRQGDVITQQQAEYLLQESVVDLYGPGIFHLIPSSKRWSGNRIAALVSFAYNLGLGAVEDSTLRKRLNAGEDPVKVVQEELPRWNRADGKVLEGLTRRRNAEVALFVGKTLQQGSFGNPLSVNWYAQLDSATDQGRRMCFSSSCAMLLSYLKPGLLITPNGDDLYLKRVQQYGDTTDPKAQIHALQSYGVKATFTQKASFKTIEQQINRGIPVPCGYLHRGPVSKPSGGGHWLCVVGYDNSNVIVHDPLGEADLVNGTTKSSVARYARYSRKNWGPRWMVEGEGTGWAIIAER
jgi:GH24 family phage-related lysozyme (muramidase)